MWMFLKCSISDQRFLIESFKGTIICTALVLGEGWVSCQIGELSHRSIFAKQEELQSKCDLAHIVWQPSYPLIGQVHTLYLTAYNSVLK